MRHGAPPAFRRTRHPAGTVAFAPHPIHQRVGRDGPPDKACDQVSDAILDAVLALDPTARRGEVLLTDGPIIAGEIT
jgi:hypothetical protein